MNFIQEIKWRGMLHDIIPGTEDILSGGRVSAYLGIDPTADSLHIGHLCGIMMLRHFQLCGHKPIVLIGGATGMIGDPSGKSEERNLLDVATINQNLKAIKKQLRKFLDFSPSAPNAAEIVNNYDWTRRLTFLEFSRDIGKHITVNYMMSKDSVKKRLGSDSSIGMSFTEFTYQLLQGYDFLYLYRNKNCRLQMGGSDQWGNITTGTELIRRIDKGEAFGITCPLITKSDGSKFGKTETGNIWLSPEYTSPYKFYQFWLNTADDDAKRYIKIFTELTEEEITDLIAEHNTAPHERKLQKRLAEEVTTMVHSTKALQSAIEASEILFGNATKQRLLKTDEKTLMAIFEGVPQFEIDRKLFDAGIQPLTLLAELTGVFPSKGEARKTIQANGLSLNKEKFTNIDQPITASHLIKDKYLLLQKGKKNYFCIIAK
ncbi:MAG: tyrosine--tRNA ligase [Bacteroidetes bacterium]|jgi:tyrosine--tRNA ligase|nr:tyrosine--tRNA ligase [Bacteroidota bacterium]